MKWRKVGDEAGVEILALQDKRRVGGTRNDSR